MIHQAFVLAAGLGKRLRPLTDDLPKPLIPIFQKPLMTFALDHLLAAGIPKLIVNTHHLPERFEEAFPNSSYRGNRIEFVHEQVLLETGGGIKNIEGQLGSEPFMTYSGDILTNFDLQPLLQEHFRSANDVTLALRRTGLGSAITLENGRVIRIETTGKNTGEFDFANVAIWSSGVFARIGQGKKVPFIPVLADWLQSGGRVGGVVTEDGAWFNIGSREQYLEVHRRILEEKWSPDYVVDPDWNLAIAPSARVDPSAVVRGCSVVSAGCQIGSGAVLDDSIVWPGAQIASRTRLANCIVRTRRRVEGEHAGSDL